MTAALWLVLALSIAYWSQAAWVTAQRPAPRADTLAPTPVLASVADLARLLGASPDAPAVTGPDPARRFVLAGVVSGLGGGAALIAVDGQPARPFRVGAVVTPGYVLKAVAPREALLAESLDGPVSLILPLPLPRPSGSNTPPSASGSPASAPASVVPEGAGSASGAGAPDPQQPRSSRGPD